MYIYIICSDNQSNHYVNYTMRDIKNTIKVGRILEKI